MGGMARVGAHSGDRIVEYSRFDGYFTVEVVGWLLAFGLRYYIHLYLADAYQESISFWLIIYICILLMRIKSHYIHLYLADAYQESLLYTLRTYYIHLYLADAYQESVCNGWRRAAGEMQLLSPASNHEGLVLCAASRNLLHLWSPRGSVCTQHPPIGTLTQT